MVGPKKQSLWPKIKWNYCTYVFCECNELQFVKKWQNFTFKVNFLCQKTTGFFSFKNINLGDNFFVKNIFLPNFWGTLISKIRPNFWPAAIHCIHKIQWFLLGMLICGQKFCFQDPPSFKFHKRNDIMK